MTRPTGSFGEIRHALARAASEAPGTVRDIAARAQVAFASARYTASRMLDEGDLEVVVPGRPAVLAARQSAGRSGATAA